uniref:Cadherin domain-containing protein n=1 Tax=Mesocestoides corti TaxID=53468 RepID=A0A5K3FVR0_MESCO
NLTHIGGSFSVLPKDCIHVVTPDSDDLLEVNVTKVQGPLYAQLVNLRDPTRPVLSFHIAELRKGLVALQLLNYAEMAEKIFTLTLVAINPFMQVSEPVSLRLVSTLQPVFPAMGFANERKPFVFQVFSLPLFSYTGALSIVQKYNLQVVGYIDESVVRFHVLANKEEEEYFKLPNATGTGGGYLRLQGVPLIGVHSTTSWTLIEIANQQLMYAHPGSLQPTVDRFRLRLTLDSQRMFYQQLVNRGLRRRRNAGVSESELELPVRVVRIYENARESALRTNVAISLHHGTAHCFMSEELITPEALQAARSDFVDLKFIVKVQPSQGDLVRRSSLLQTSVNVTQSHQQLSSLSGSDGDKEAPQISVVGLAELERHDICYLSHRRDARIDMFGLKQTGRSGFPVVAVNINIHPRPKYQLTKRVDPSQLLEVRETVNFAAITSNYLRFVVRPTRQWLRSSAHNLMPLMPNASEIVYTITRQPRFLAGPSRDAGRLVSLAAASASQHEGDMALRPGLTSLLRELEPTGVTQFSQDQVNSGDIVYVPPVEDIGPTNQMAEFSYTVSAPGIMVFNKERFRFRVIAEDDQTPLLELLKPLEVHRDGEVAIDSEILRLTDEDTLVEKLVLRLTRAPTHGNIFESVQISVFNATTNATTSKMDRRKLGEGEVISASLINLGKLSYIQDGSNVKEDSFNLTASDGYQESVPLKLKVTIRPRVLSEPVWNLLVNNSILVEENSTVILHPSVFPPLTPPPMGGARFFVVVPPTKGKLVLDKRCKMSQFSTNDVANSRIAYRHGPTEIGTDAKFDLVRVWDFKTGNIFSLNFTLLPINSQPPTITAVTPLQVNEGSSVVLSHHAISVRDPDTIDANIRIKLITHPKWGHLELRPENTSSVGFADFSFTAEDLSDGRVYYINSRHRDGLESVSDIFSLRAYDQEFQSKEAIPIHVSIHPVNDEIPSVRLVDYFSVPLNGRRVLTPYLLAISDRDVPRDILQIAFPQLPRFGHLTVYWQHGEQYTITESSAPISESYLGMMNLVYIQNCSVELPARDTFTVSVSDGQHVVKKSAHILLRQENRYGPEIKVAEEGGLVIEGLAWRQLTTALSVSDVDTLAEDLIITVLRAPSLGRLERLQRQEIAGSPAVEDLLEIALDRFEEEMSGNKRDTKALREGDSFTKRQLDSGRIYYTYTGEYTSSYVYDSITLSASDGRFEAGPIDVPIRIRATKGRKNQVVQSQSSLNAELLEKSKADSDPLLSDAASEPWD